VFWNDAQNGFSAEQVSVVNEDADSPQAFTALAAMEGKPPSLVYVTGTQARKVSVLREKRRSFAAAETVADLLRGTGISSGDYNGDGLTDLALVDGGTLRVLRAKLKPR